MYIYAIIVHFTGKIYFIRDKECCRGKEMGVRIFSNSEIMNCAEKFVYNFFLCIFEKMCHQSGGIL